MNREELREELKRQYADSAKLSLLSLAPEDALEVLTQVISAHSMIEHEHLVLLAQHVYKEIQVKRRIDSGEVLPLLPSGSD